MRLYLIALQFLTIIPLPCDTGCQKDDLGRATSYFPLVGLTIGAMLLFDYAVLSQFLGVSLVAALVVASLALITGALHLDGLADVCDAFAARGGRERFLAIMKDSHTGAAGAVAVAIGLLLKWQALAAVPSGYAMAAILLFPTISRTAQLCVMAGAEHARDSGLGNLFVSSMGKKQVVAGLLFCVVAIGLTEPLRGSVALLASIILALFVRGYFQKRIGGVTGDVIGFVNELTEILTLIIFSAVLR